MHVRKGRVLRLALFCLCAIAMATVAIAAQAAKQTVMAPMSDGVKLATDVYVPQGGGKVPAVLSRTPYNRKGLGHEVMGAGLNRAGCAYVIQDMRGRFESEGENLPFIACGWGEHRDGAETVAWIVRQPWSDGKVGTMGGSALGITQNLMAGAVPQGLAAQYINVAPASMYHQATYIGGAFRKEQIENWTAANRFDPKAVEIMKAHPCYDDYWRGFDSSLKWPVMNVPAVHVGGWFDTFAQGTIDSFVGRQHHGAEGAKGRQKLVMGPWAHAGARPEGVGELKFPNNRMPKEYESAPWFQYHLKGVENGVMKLPAVTYYVMGDSRDPKAPGNEWRRAEDWPILATDTRYYFSQGGELLAAAPGAEQTVGYTFDPANPCPTVGGKNLTIPAGPRNQNPIESRKDVLLFTTAPLAAPLEVTGRVRGKVFVVSSAADTDLSVRLCDVYPDGKSYEMAEGILRLRYRKSLEKPEPLVPGEVAEAQVDCWSTSVVFNKGHRVRVIVTSSNFPRFDLNPGTGKPWTEGGEVVKQANRIFCGGGKASCVILPVVKPKP